MKKKMFYEVMRLDYNSIPKQCIDLYDFFLVVKHYLLDQ